MATIQNKFGELIHIKLENDRIYIHHEDATDGFVTLDELMMKIILSDDELILLYNGIKTLAQTNHI